VRGAKVATLVGLLCVITVTRIFVGNAGYGIAFYALIPIVLSAFWLGRRGALIIALTAAAIFVVTELIWRSPTLAGAGLWAATINRSVIYLGVAVIVTALLERERQLRDRVDEQQQRLTELESLRAALTPAEVPSRPGLQLATAFLPAEGLVAGDFFLIAAGPAHSTTLVVGDVVGHGLEAARQASFARATLATFAPFTDNPAQLLQLAHTALIERADNQAKFLTAVCVNITRDNRLSWARAGHYPPWLLPEGQPLDGDQPGHPLGIGESHLGLTPASRSLHTGAGIVLFTDGLPEGRPAHRDPSVPLELYGEQRIRAILAAHQDASADQIVDALSAAVTNFAGGRLADDVCIIACRTTSVPPLPTSALDTNQQRSEATGHKQIS
jgi:serine phosphatase RsbU (regulator of sigma subunit)